MPDTDDIQQIAPTPWKPSDDYHALIRDVNGSLLDMPKCRDRIIACVNFCAGVPTKELNEATRQSVVCRILPPFTADIDTRPLTPGDTGFAAAAAVVKRHRPNRTGDER